MRKFLIAGVGLILLTGCYPTVDLAKMSPEESACYAQALAGAGSGAWQPGTMGAFMYQGDRESEIYVACLRGKGIPVDPKRPFANKMS